MLRRPYDNFPRRQLRSGFWTYLRSNRREVGEIVLAIAGCIAVIVFLNRNFFGGYLAGFLTMFLVGIVTWNYLINNDGLRYLDGAWAEDWTRDELRAAVKRGEAWHALDNLPLAGGDIDHVLVSPGGVLAVETRFFGKESRTRYLSENASGARRCATRVRGVLKTLKAADHPVHPVLVVWGPGGRHLSDIGDVDGVAVVRGPALPDFLCGFATGRLAEDHADNLAAAFSAYREALPETVRAR